MPSLGEFWLTGHADVKEFGSEIKKGIQRPAEEAGREAGSRLTKGIQNAFAVAGGIIASDQFLALIGFFKDAVKGAADMAETQSKVNFIFGQSAGQIQAFAANAGRSLGQTRQQAFDAASTFAIFGKSAGLTGDQLVGFSTRMVTLATDLASFNNTSPEQAIDAIGAALRGETEPIRAYGVLLDDATLRQRALALGLINTTKNALTPQQRVLAAQAEILAQTSTQQGDFARTSGSAANQVRIASAEFANFKTVIGDLLLPILIRLMSFITGPVIGTFQTVLLPLIRQVRDWFVAGFSGAAIEADGFGHAIGVVGQIAHDAWDLLGQLWVGVKAAAAAFQEGDVTSDGFVGSMEVLGNVLRDVVDGISTVIGWVRDYWQILLVAIGTVYAMAAAHAVLVAGGLAAYIRQLPLVISLTDAWAASQKFLNLMFVATPIGWIVLIIGLLVAAVIYAYTHFQGFRDVVQATWSGIKDAARVAWEGVLKPLFEGIVVAIKFVIAYYEFLWHAVQVAWDVISAAARIAWGILNGIFTAVVNALAVYLVPAFHAFQAVSTAVWNVVSFAVQTAWAIINVIFRLIQLYLEATLGPVFRGFMVVVQLVWNGIKSYFQDGWNKVTQIFGLIVGIINTVVLPIFRNFAVGAKAAWDDLTARISQVWNGTLKPLFDAFGRLIKDDLTDKFRTGVNIIKTLWDGIKQAVKDPINIAIQFFNKGIRNPFNTIAKAIGVQQTIPEMPGLARGGHIRGAGTETSDSIAAWLSDNEYVIPAKTVRRFGVGFFDRLIGQPRTARPGDGSEGLAFVDGGIVGNIVNGITNLGEKLWDVITDPSKYITAVADRILNLIPGGGMLRDLAQGSGRTLASGLINWIKNFGGEGGSVGKTQAFVRAQAGKPYIWASAGPSGYDCSGMVSAAYRVFKGRTPGPLFTTHNEAPFFPLPGDGVFTAGWANSGERGGGSVGHTAARIGGLMFESRGSRGVVVGTGVTPLSSFAHIGHFDGGGYLWPGSTLAVNTSGRPERVTTADMEDRIVDTLERLVEAVDRVAPGVGREINGLGRSIVQMGRAN